MAPLSLLDALAEVPDPRSRHGRRHPLLAILSLTVLAMLRGCKGPTAIAQFGRDHGVALAHALGFLRGKTPAPSCFCELFSRLDAAAFEAALSRWVASRMPPAEEADQQPVSLDGKTLRGSRDGEGSHDHYRRRAGHCRLVTPQPPPGQPPLAVSLDHRAGHGVRAQAGSARCR